MPETLTIAGREFRSCLIVGTGKHRSFKEMQRCHEASGAEMMTVAVRTAMLAREAGLSPWIKLEVIGDEKTLLPDMTRAMNLAVESGRMPRKLYASASSPLAGVVGS
jgi:thiazole synthase